MSMRAQISSTHDDGSPRTLRDESGGLWRLVADGGGEYAIEEIPDPEGSCASIEEVPAIRPGIAYWGEDESLLTVKAVVCDPRHERIEFYDVSYDCWVAGSREWEKADEAKP